MAPQSIRASRAAQSGPADMINLVPGSPTTRERRAGEASILRTAISAASSLYVATNTTGRLIPMEGIRGLAVLLVFFVHFDALFGEYAGAAPVLRSALHFLGVVGNAGVDLFFLLSGYLIYGGLIRKRPDAFRFLKRRYERIYPTFLAVLGLYIVLSLVFPEVSRIHGLPLADLGVYLAQNLLLLPGVFSIAPIITVTWSLSYEMFSYLAMISIVLATRMWTWSSRSRVVFFVCVWIVYFGLSLRMQHSLVRALMFVVGILLFEAMQNDRFRRRLNPSRELLAVALVLLSFVFAYLLDRRPDLLMMLPVWKSGWNLAPGVTVYHGPYKTLAFSISMFLLTAHACASSGRLSKLFSWSPLRWLGNMSYSYYLIHGVTLQGLALLLRKPLASNPADGSTALLLLAVAFGATWITATFLFVAVEKRFSLTAAPTTSKPDARNAVSAG